MSRLRRRIIPLCATVFAALVGAGATAFAGPSVPLATTMSAPGGPQLVCRGPFSIQADSVGVTLHAVKNATAAGRFGENLAPSSCALEDRALAGNESATLRVAESPYTKDLKQVETNWLDNTLPFLAQCVGTKRCLLWSKSVYYPKSSMWAVGEADLRITWPDFVAMQKTKSKGKTKSTPSPQKKGTTTTKMPKMPSKKSSLPPGASPF
jgi:hypothetical protein